MSIKGTDFMLNPEKLEKEFMLVEIAEWTDFNTKEKLGFNYVVLFPKLQYEKVKVSVKSNFPIVTKEELKRRGKSLSHLRICAHGQVSIKTDYS